MLETTRKYWQATYMTRTTVYHIFKKKKNLKDSIAKGQII